MTQLVGINGFKRSGKGETANFLAQDCTAGVVYQVGFADKVKQYAARSLGLTGSPPELVAMMNEAKLDRADGGWLVMVQGSITFPAMRVVTGREYLQHVGTEARKLFGDDFWVDQVLPRVPATVDSFDLPGGWAGPELARMYPEVDIVAFTDLRFENEAERIHACGGVVWEVVRPGMESDGHDSEQVLPRHLIDYQIDNSGSLSDLRHEVESATEATLN